MPTKRANVNERERPKRRRCLILEQHEWQTPNERRSLFVPNEIASMFFGGARKKHTIRVRTRFGTVPSDWGEDIVALSVVPAGLSLRIPLITCVPYGFVFLEEQKEGGFYDFWWHHDRPLVACCYGPWRECVPGKIGRGRLWTIIDAPVRPRVITTIGT